MSTRVRILACLFFLAHFVASVYLVLTSIGANMAFTEAGPQITPKPLLEIGEKVLTFPILSIAVSLPSAVSPFIPLWAPLIANSLLWSGIILLLASKRARYLRAA
jgi:hypothetical protein